ncbi:hypothetical protein [Corynebacterium tapiri]|uniref:DUF559 domain-containing protein n=1 Tax=Corynebacterium tapiri TaxID=1448266 RepID=A0A5C4U612_9CORY|nr:hypothetical protein [Corynebacterium tapiri]TNL99836.1 hypothetical protein FHE74_02035 [Corynebacterium tapiri]
MDQILSREELRARFTRREVEQLVRAGELFHVARGVHTTAPPQGLVLARALLLAYAGLIYSGDTACQLHLGQPLSLPLQAIGSMKCRAIDTDLLVRKASRCREHVHVKGVPVTPVAHTLAWLAEFRRIDDARALLQHSAKDRSHVPVLLAAIHALPRIPTELRALLDTTPIAQDSAAETRLHGVLERAGFALRCNVKVGHYFYDLLVEDRVLVELNSRTYHSTWDQRTKDAWKANEAQAAGYMLIAVTVEDLDRHPAQVMEIVRLALERPRSPEQSPVMPRPVWEWNAQVRFGDGARDFY